MSRVFVLLKASLSLRSRFSDEIIYCFGMDMLFLCLLSGFGRKQVIYEVADIRPIVLNKHVKGRLARILERNLLKFVDLVVVTAPGYISGYYKKILNVSPAGKKYFVLENKIDPLSISLNGNQTISVGSKIRIGYFGLLRCSHSWEVLKKLVSASPDVFEVHIYGRPINPVDLPEQAKLITGIYYHGEFLWPSDLEAMYCSVDIVWACYPYGDNTPGNWQWARTNRFYESCFFCKPLITLQGSADEKVASELNIGIPIDLSNIDMAVNYLAENLDSDLLLALTENTLRVPKGYYLYTDDHVRLVETIDMIQS